MTREQAISTLEARLMCDDVIYVHEHSYAEALVMAIEALKAQEPRVMTLEEVKSLERDAVVWYEHNGVNKQRPRIVDQVYDSGIIFTDGGHWQFNADAYGKKFRLWTSRPTDEQREKEPWNG